MPGDQIVETIARRLRWNSTLRHASPWPAMEAIHVIPVIDTIVRVTFRHAHHSCDTVYLGVSSLSY